MTPLSLGTGRSQTEGPGGVETAAVRIWRQRWLVLLDFIQILDMCYEESNEKRNWAFEAWRHFAFWLMKCQYLTWEPVLECLNTIPNIWNIWIPKKSPHTPPPSLSKSLYHGGYHHRYWEVTVYVTTYVTTNLLPKSSSASFHRKEKI